MRIRAKKVLLVLVILILSLSALYPVIIARAKNTLVSKLSQLSSQNVSIGTLAFRLPATIQIKDLEIGERKDQRYFSIGRAAVFFAPVGSLLKLKPVITSIEIDDPRLYYEREAPSKAVPSKSTVRSFGIFPNILEVSNGTIEFVDRMPPVKKLAITLANGKVFSAIKDHPPSDKAVMFMAVFDLIQGPQSPAGKISVRGHVYPITGNTNMRFEIKRADGMYFYPYYAQWLDLEKAHFQTALLDFSADITGIGSKFTAACRLELAESSFLPLPKGQEPDRPQKLAMLIVDVLKTTGNGKAFVDFELAFDRDNPHIDMKPLGAAFSEKIKNGFAVKPADVKEALKLPEHLIQKTASTLGGITKTVLGQTVELGQQLTQSVQDTFIKVTPKKQD